MGKSKVRTLLISCVMILLCAAMIVGGTYALWSNTVEINTHLSAGKLEVTLDRTYLKKRTLGENMRMEEFVDENKIDLTNASTTANVFGMSSEEVIVPTAYYAARLLLTNSGDVAIDYTISIIVNNDTDEELAKQVKVYLGSGDDVDDVDYDAGRYLATEADGNVTYTQFEIGRGVLDGTKKSVGFWVKIVFDDVENNNAAQSKGANFDLSVKATQKTD